MLGSTVRAFAPIPVLAISRVVLHGCRSCGETCGQSGNSCVVKLRVPLHSMCMGGSDEC